MDTVLLIPLWWLLALEEKSSFRALIRGDQKIWGERCPGPLQAGLAECVNSLCDFHLFPADLAELNLIPGI